MQMEELEAFPRRLAQFRTRRGLGRMLGSLAVAGAIVAAYGDENAMARKKGKRGRSGGQGPAGPAGPAGPVGPEGPAGAPVTFVSITAQRSAVLAATAGSEVQSVAECGFESVPVNCGWSLVGEATDFDRTTTQVEPGFLRGVGMCTVRLRRTAAVARAGGQVIATAICTSSGL
jgi:hypothetical protein